MLANTLKFKFIITSISLVMFNNLSSAQINGSIFTDYIKSTNTTVNDFFGFNTVISGNTIAVSARNIGTVYIFKKTSNSWNQSAIIPSLGQISSIALDNKTLVIGVPSSNNACGSVQVFVENNENWILQDELKTSICDFFDDFGHSVSISNNTIIVGANQEDSNSTGVNSDQKNNLSNDSGAAYIFIRNSQNNWQQQAYLKASNTGDGDWFGGSVSIYGDTAVVSAYNEDSDGNSQFNDNISNSGAVYVFTRTNNNWVQSAFIKSTIINNNDGFGDQIVLFEETIAISAPSENGGSQGVNGNQADQSISDSGAAYIFKKVNSNWIQEAYLKASNPDISDRFGFSIGMHSDHVIVGTYLEDSNATGVNNDDSNNLANTSGAAYYYTKENDQWIFKDYIKASNTQETDSFGISVATSNQFLSVGAHREDSNSAGINGNETDNSSFDSGAVYLFEINTIFENGFESLSQDLPPSVSISASPSTVNFGGSSTLSWLIDNNAEICIKSGSWSGLLSPSEITNGSHFINLNNITTTSEYTLTCSNASGSNQGTTSITIN